MNSAQPDFAVYQTALNRALRDPCHPLPPGADARRAAIYQHLLRNNVHGFVESCFPVTRALVGETRWQDWVETFFREGTHASPLFQDIPNQFADWLGAHHADNEPDWLAELIDYEHAELRAEIHAGRVSNDRGCAFDGGAAVAGPDDAPPLRVNPTAQLLCYAHAVHELHDGSDVASIAPRAQPVCLIVWRDTAHRVRTLSVSAPLLRLLELLREHDNLLSRALHVLSIESGLEFKALQEFAMPLMAHLQAEQIITS